MAKALRLQVFAIGLLAVCQGFSTGAPDFSCKDPSTFHTRAINATHEGVIMPQSPGSNPYRIRVESTTFNPGDRIRVTLYSETSNQPIRGFFLQAIQADINIRDLRRRSYGRFENLTSDEKPSVCESTRNWRAGGVTHTNSRTHRAVTVVWVAPEEWNPGPLQFLGTGVLDYNTYWTDVRSPQINPVGYPTVGGHFSPALSSETAAWYQWLQYIRNQQQQQRNAKDAGSDDKPGVTKNSQNTPTPLVNDQTVAANQAHSKNDSSLVGKGHATGSGHDAGLTLTDITLDSLAEMPGSGLGRPLTIHDHGHPDHDHSIHH
ncbi:uncharacterized protein LOC127880885 [Dreissena polymorpha]|uniref:Reelin domain-containing protein n=1 Tax=Dreissena polymorpha TaxID=45954 RepID=A0A9D4GN98_DREPO|nr:uncharacterized protein LOC127880885 [Dreissena polymorpha]KAH3818516.1 hypothetical protein DPMN_120237 [Dreissena polymorpha]